MTDKHTPLPWSYENAFTMPGWAILASDRTIAFVESKKDAAFIVHCVNMHDELVGVLGDLINDPGGDGVYDKARAILERATA